MTTSCLDKPTAEDRTLRGGAPEATRGLTRHAYLNSICFLLDYTAKAAVILVVTPILVTALGRSLFGVWQVLMRWVNYMSAADGRPTQTLTQVIANHQASNDATSKRRYIGSAIGVWLAFLPLLMLIGMGLIWLSPLVTRARSDHYAIVRVTCALLLVNFLVGGLANVPDAVLRGMNLGYKRMGLRAGLSILGGALTVGAVYAGLGLIGIAGAQVVLTILTGALFWRVVKRCLPWFGFVLPSIGEVRSFLMLSGWYTAATFLELLVMASDVIILGVLTAPAVVAIYALTGHAAYTLGSAISMTLGSVTPGLGGLIGRKDYERASRVRGEMMAISWLLVTTIGSTILMWNRSFVHLWVGTSHYAGFLSNLLIVVIMSQAVFIRIDDYIVDLTLELRVKVLVGVCAIILSVALALALVPSLGIRGLCLSVLAGRSMLSVCYPLIVRSYFRCSHPLSVGTVVRPAVVTGILFAAAACLGQRLLAGRWVEWLVGAGVTFAVTVAITGAVGLAPDLRRSLIRRVRLVWRREAEGLS